MFFERYGLKVIQRDDGLLALRMAHNVRQGLPIITGYEDHDVIVDMEYRCEHLRLEMQNLFLQMLEQHPDARFILNVRPKGEWLRSRLGWRRAWEDFRQPRELLDKLAPYRECACDRMVPMVEQDSALLGITQERVPDFWLAEWDEHVARVKREIPEDRL